MRSGATLSIRAFKITRRDPPSRDSERADDDRIYEGH